MNHDRSGRDSDYRTVSERDGSHIVAVILAGGRGRRMGGPKAAVRRPDGRMLLDVVGGVVARFATHIAVVGAADMAPSIRDRGFARLDDRALDDHVSGDQATGAGPVAGIDAALAWNAGASHAADVMVIVPVDMAWLDRDPQVVDSFRELARSARTAPGGVMRYEAVGHDLLFPLAIRVSADTQETTASFLAEGHRSLRAWLARVRCASIPLSPKIAEFMCDADTPEDLRRDSRRFRGKDVPRGIDM